jgi:hypothetical protein
MKKGILIILILGLFLTSFASITLTRYNSEGNPIEIKQISDSKGNQIEVRVKYLEDKGVFYGEMSVIEKDNSVDEYASYSQNFNFYTTKSNYMKYEKPALYNTIKWSIRGAVTVTAFILSAPLGAHIGIVGAFGGINGGIIVPVMASTLAFSGTIIGENIIENYEEEKWIIIRRIDAKESIMYAY